MAKTSYQHKKFVRSAVPPKTIRLQARDVEMMREIAVHRFLDTKQIMTLFPGAKTNLLRRLQYLFHHGFLDRPVQQQAIYFKSRNHLIYALGNKGADCLFAETPELRGRANWQIRNRDTKSLYLEHGLMISDFYTALQNAFAKIPEVELLSWLQQETIKTYVKIAGKNAPVNPDAFFIINREKSNPFFLEADRSTMTDERFLKKMIAYWEWWKVKGHEEKFHIKNFRVLTITKSEARKENLRKITRQADPTGRGSEMFLFACANDYNLDDPASILEAIWQSPKDDSRHSFSDLLQ